jgi:hypothetical protein
LKDPFKSKGQKQETNPSSFKVLDFSDIMEDGNVLDITQPQSMLKTRESKRGSYSNKRKVFSHTARADISNNP